MNANHLFIVYIVIVASLAVGNVEAYQKSHEELYNSLNRVIVKRQASDGCFCNLLVRHVCGSDGKTYTNPCQLNCAKKRNPGLRKVKEGMC